MSEGLTYKEAAALVLREADRPLSVQEILQEIQKRRLVEVSGKTPVKTLHARISTDIKRNVEASLFTRIAPGLFAYNHVTYLQAAEIVLSESQRPLSAKQIIEEIKRRNLISISGETPLKTMNARISMDIKKGGKESSFKRIGRGIYALRKQPGLEYISKPHRRKEVHVDKTLGSDRVLVFPKKLLDKLGRFHGIRTDYELYEDALLNPENSFHMDRLRAEGTSEYKQIVCYVIIQYQGLLLRFKRGKMTTLRHLIHDQYSIGFGGHVQERDWNLFSHSSSDFGYSETVARELKEEVKIDIDDPSVASSKIVGVLNDDSSPLGRRHFAFIHQVVLTEPSFGKGEKSINELGLVGINEISDNFGQYEYWSKLCVQALYGDEVSFGCYVHKLPGFKFADESKYVLIVGYIGSGKTEACTLLESEFDYEVIRCSRVMQEAIGCGSIEEIGRRKLQDLGYDFINGKDGHSILAKAIEARVLSSSKERFVFDGLRYPQTLSELEAILKAPITVIYIESTIDNLFRYYQDRDPSLGSFSEFLNIVHHPVERQIERFLPVSHIVVFNHGSLDSYISTLRDFFGNELGGGV